MPSDEIIWGDWTGVDLVRRLYHWLAIEVWSCHKFADHLNNLGVPTAYTKDGRLVKVGERKERTQGKWRAGRIRNIVVQPVYKGEQHYGRRTTKTGGRKVIISEVPALVPKEIWEAAQKTLSGNRLMAKNTKRYYLLKSVIRCGSCGLTYIANRGRGFPWYRCNGRLTDRGPIPERCPSKALKGPVIERLVWDDVERFLRDPRDILEELSQEQEMDAGVAIVEAERITLEGVLADLVQRRKNAIDLNLRGTTTYPQMDDQLGRIINEKEGVQKRLDELRESTTEAEEPINPDLLEELRRRLDEGLDDLQRQEIARMLVRQITVHTEETPEGKKAKVLIEYRFPAVVNTFTDTDSWPPPV